MLAKLYKKKNRTGRERARNEEKETRPLNWPDDYGFSIYGKGPAFIVSVDPGGIADQSGLHLGDEIMQVNDDDVGGWSADKIKDLVSKMKSAPPSLGVVSRLKEITLTCLSSKHKYFGLTFSVSSPVVISSVESGSPAYYNSLKPNDILLKVSGINTILPKQARHLLDECTLNGKAQVGVIPVPVSNDSSNNIEKTEQSNVLNKDENNMSIGQLKAKELLGMIKQSFGNHPLEIQKIVGSIQKYSKQKDIEVFAEDITACFLYAKNGWKLVEHLRFFLPPHHKELFDIHIERCWKGKAKQNLLKELLLKGKIAINCSLAPPFGKCDVTVQHDRGIYTYLERTRSITISRGRREFGITVGGHSPVVIQDVEKGSPADEAGIVNGDSILALNGIDIRNVSHSKAVALIQGSGSMPTLVIQSSTGTLPQSGTSGLSCQSLYSSQSSTSSSRYFVPPPAFSDHYLSKHQQPFLEKSKAFGCWKEEQEDSDWTTKYVPITYLVKGKSFKQQVDLLLKSDEIATLKNTLFEFVSRRSVDSLLFHLYPLFNGIGKGREILWHYVLHCLTHHEKSHLKKRLYDLTHTYLADFSEAANPTISSNSQNMKEQTSTSTTDSIVCCTPPNGCENQQSPGRRSRRRQAARSSIVLENSEEGPSSSVTLPYNDAASSNNENAICPLTRRYRRRKTVGNIHFTDEEHAAANEDYARHIESLRHPASKSIASSKISASTISEQERAFYDDEKQAERRRRRELSKTSRRRRVVGAEPPFEPFTEAGQSFSSECRPLSCGPLATFQPLNENNETAVSEGAVLRRNRRRSNRQTIETSKTTMNGFRGNLITNLQQSLTFPGDKKKKSKSDTSSTKRQEVSTLPTSSIDDAVSEQQTAPNHRGRESKISSHSTQSSIKQHQEELDSTAETKQQLNEVNDQAVINGKANSNQSNHEDSLFKSDRQNLSSGLSPQFNAIFLEDSKQKKNYLNALKKKLTFSRPPKNNDTDTFLCELSAQFDEEMNLVDDIEIVEENKNDFKFGEKWSYLPKSRSLEFEEAKDDFPTVESILNEVKDFEIMQESKASQFNETGCKISLDKTLNTVSVCNIIDDIDDREVPPFPVDLGEVENESPSYPPPSPAPIVNILPPVVRYSPPTVNPTPPPEVAPVEKSETSNRTERVRRRRRRNAENAARKNEETTHNDFAPKNDSEAIRRISDPLPALQSPQQDHAFEDDKVIYDVPKPVVATQRRAHVNIEKRTRRSRANRPTSMVSKRNSTEVRMHVWTDNDLSNNNNNNESGKVKMRSSSPVEQTTFFERAKKKNYRVSGISMAMEDIFSEAEEDLHENEFSPPPPTSPPAPAELTASQGDACDPDEVYAPLHEEVLALGLAYDENEQKEEEVYQTPQSSVGVNTVPDPSKIPPPPPLPPPVPPPPPPVPLSPPLMFKNNPPNSPVRISVKRINWEKLEPANLDNTVWGQLGEDFEQINDAVKYLDLEEHFAMKNAKALKMKNKEVKKDVISIMAHKKAYNTSILLAHLKLSHREICDCLLITGTEATRKKMDSSHYKQLLMYAPDHEEVEKFNQFKGDVSKLNEADLLALKLVKIPGYQLRLKALVFKHSFAEKEEEIQRNLSVIQKASFQLRKSRKLAKILEFVLAMGNYMNRGHVRISKATGFRIHFLAEMDSTKTSDNKLTFLHILARAVISKFPDVVTFVDEIPDVKHAARIIYPAVSEDLQQLRKVWLDVRDNLHETASKNKQDRFKIAMETCLVRTNGAIKRLEQLHNATVKEFNKVAQYFGENPKNVGMQQFFKIFEEFTRKFEKSHNEIKKFVKTKPSSTPKR